MFHHTIVFLLALIISVLGTSLTVEAKEADNKNVTSNDGFTNADALVQYGPYGVALNEFSVDKDGQIDYPVFVQTVLDGEKNGLEPCDDFYEFVTNGALRRKEQNSEAWTKGKYTLGLDDQYLLEEETITFWKEHLNSTLLRKEFPADERSEKMFIFYDKCRENAKTASDEEWIKVVGKMLHTDLSKNELPMNVFDTDWMERTFPFSPFFEITRIASKERSHNGQGPWVAGSEIRIDVLGALSRDGIEELQKDEKSKLLVEELAKQQNKRFNETELQNKLLEIADAFAAVEDAYNTADEELGNKSGPFIQEKARVAKLSLNEMQTQFSVGGELNWLEWAQRLFPDIKAEDRNGTAVVVYNINFMRQLLDLIGKYAKLESPLDKAAFSNYLLWSLIDSATNYLSGLSGDGDINEPRTESWCLTSHLIAYFQHPLTELQFRKMKLEDIRIDGDSSNKNRLAKTPMANADGNVPLEAFDVYRYVKKGYEKMFNESSWFGEDRTKMAMEIVEKVHTTIGMQSELPAPDEVYRNLYKSYALNANMTWLEVLVEVERKTSQLVPVRQHRYNGYEATFYFYWQNVLGNNRFLLPDYHRQFPAAYHFATMGFSVATQLGYFLLPNDRVYHELEPSLKDFWRQDHIDTHNKRASCFDAQYRQEFGKIYKNQTYTSLLIYNLGDNFGMVAAFNGWQLYEEDQRKKGVPAKNPFEKAFSKKYSSEQVFFLAFAYGWMEYLSDQDPTYFTWRDDPDHSPNRLSVNLPLKNFPEFSEAFNCKKPGNSQPMNPAEKCFLYNN